MESGAVLCRCGGLDLLLMLASIDVKTAYQDYSWWKLLLPMAQILTPI